MFMTKKALFLTYHLWEQKIKTGIHFFGKFFLERGYEILWISLPLSFFKVPQKKERLKLAFSFGKKFKENSTFLINASFFTPIHPINLPFLKSYFVAKNFIYFSFPPVFFLLKKYNFLRPEIFFFDVGGVNGNFLSFVKPKLIIYRMNDDLEGFRKVPSGRLILEKELIKKADLILAVTEDLVKKAKRIKGSSKGIFYLPNGVDLKVFFKKAKIPKEYKKIPSPRAVYIGSLSDWFDWNLLISTAKIKKEVSFVIIGKGRVPKALPSNIFFLGEKKYEKLPSFLQYANVGLIPFKESKLIENMERPLKFYEYLASGLPPVSTPVGKLKKGMSPFAFFGKNPQEFAKAIDKALSLPKEEREKLKEKAKEFSWENIFQKFQKIFQKYEASF